MKKLLAVIALGAMIVVGCEKPASSGKPKPPPMSPEKNKMEGDKDKMNKEGADKAKADTDKKAADAPKADAPKDKDKHK